MTEQTVQQQVNIERVYVKDISVETHDLAKSFSEQWQPNTQIDLSISHQALNDNRYEVTLRLTITIKDDQDNDKIILEVHQSAIFLLSGFEKDQLSHLLEAYCPGVLFPYARAEIARLTNCITIPTINLAPINFEAIYQQKLQNEKDNKTS